MPDRSQLVRVAITEIPDIHLLPGWDRQFQVEQPIDLEIQRVNSRQAHALLSGDRGTPYDVAIVAEEPTLAEYPTEAYERVVIGADTFSLVMCSDDAHPRLAALRAWGPYVRYPELKDLLLHLGDHRLLMRERGAGVNVYIFEHLLGGLVADGRIGPDGCVLLEEERANEALVGGVSGGDDLVAIVPNSVLWDVTVPRGQVDVVPIVHAPFRPYFMLRRREGELDSAHERAIGVLWDYLLDYVGARRERSQLGADRVPVARRPEAVLLGVDIVNFTLMRQEHQRTAVRLLNSLTQHVVASIEPVRRALWTAISTGDGLILVLDGALAATPLFDAMIGINLALRQLFDTLGRNLGLGGGIGARMAMHSGPVLTVYDPGGDLNFVGPGVNVLQRILEFGNAGQVLATHEALGALTGADGVGAMADQAWSGWDKHGIEYRVHAISGEGFGDPTRPARLDQRFR